MREKKVLTLGFFDGIHIGHAALLRCALQLAVQARAEAAVMTFDVHPDALITGRSVPLINSAEDRHDLLRRLFHIENVFLLPFNEETRRMPWDVFLRQLTAQHNVAGYVVGHDFRFGWMGQGNGEKLSDWCEEHGLLHQVIPPVTLEGQVVSSTGIRQLLARGDLAGANRRLGHAHQLTADCVNGVLTIPDGVETLPDGRYSAFIQNETTGLYQGVVATALQRTLTLDDATIHGHVRLEFTGCLC